MQMYSYPAFRIPVASIVSAVSRTSESLTSGPNWFQLIQPIGGVGANIFPESALPASEAVAAAPAQVVKKVLLSIDSCPFLEQRPPPQQPLRIEPALHIPHRLDLFRRILQLQQVRLPLPEPVLG